MAHPAGESNDEVLKLDFDRRLMLQFRGSVVTSDAGLLAYRELDDTLGLTETAIERLADARPGRNGRHALVGLLRQSVFGRLAGYEDVNDAERLRHDPAMRWIVGGKAAVLAQISTRLRKTGRFSRAGHTVMVMVTILCALVSIFEFRVRSRASLELELIALRHQVTVLRRQRPGRPQLSSLDRLLWVWLYRIWPQVIDAMVLVKPATVVQWHRKGFRLYWRWRSRRPGRPKIGREIRDLIRRMSKANPLWGAPRIHGELLKLGIKISQATVGRWMPWRPKVPSPTWRTFLQNHLHDIAAIDMFVVATARFRLLYALIVLSLDRRRVVHFEVTQNPTQVWLSGQMTEAFPWDTAPRYLLRDRDKSYGPAFRYRVRAMGLTEVITARRSPWQNPYAERLIGSIRRECLDHVKE